MVARMNIAEATPEGYRTVLGLERYTSANVDPVLLHLVKMRASILNGCSFCVDMHSRDALAAGESTERLFGVAAWHDFELFTTRERAALALCDSVTRLGPDGVPDEVWDTAADEFESRELADLLIATATINLWNRLTVPTRTPPGTGS